MNSQSSETTRDWVRVSTATDDLADSARRAEATAVILKGGSLAGAVVGVLALLSQGLWTAFFAWAVALALYGLSVGLELLSDFVRRESERNRAPRQPSPPGDLSI
jgi:hypothetical protein